MLTRVQKPLTDPSPGLFRMNRHIMWTIPTVNLVVFGFCGLVAALVLRARPRLGVRVAVGPLVFLADVDAAPFLPVAARAGLPGSGVLVRLPADEANRIEAPRLPAAGQAHAAGDGGAGGRRDRVVARRAESLAYARRPLRLPAVSAGGQDAPGPNVLLVVLDTVRADHLSLHGYGRDTSPNLSRLARRGITFKQARSTAPWTLPSHASMMTGRWPHELS